MMALSTPGLTELLDDWQQGDRSALERLTPLIYDELRRIAHRYVRRERNGHTLQTTQRVNEAYFRLAEQGKPDGRNGPPSFAAPAQGRRPALTDQRGRRPAPNA